MVILNKCPICENEGDLLYSLEPEYIRTQLHNYFHSLVNENINIRNYDIFKCKYCTLEYAMPMQAGDESFYTWITDHSSYYPNNRWEWSIVLDIIKFNAFNNINLLEIGCGAGDFLELAQKIPNLNSVGIDLTKTSVDECCRKGLTAHCETIDDYIKNQSHDIRKFDFIVAFHTLEHVNDPKGFLMSLVPLLKSQASLFMSTPLSPMSFESSWFDPLNHPPHHLTRWNIEAYSELAKQLGMEINFYTPAPQKIFVRTLASLNLKFNGNIPFSKSKVFLECLKNPQIAFKEYIKQMNRMKLNNQPAADVVLLQLVKS